MKPLAACWITYGVFRICAGVAMVFFAPTATVMFGALLGRVADPYTLMGAFHVLYVIAIVLSFVCGLLGIAGGLAMQGNSKAYRGLMILASLLALTELPVGVALGVYTLIALLPAGHMKSVQAN
jgi:hypothetical protein